jgi:hypothetical protein
MPERVLDYHRVGPFLQSRKAGGGEPPGGRDMHESRVAKLESAVEYIKENIGEMKPDIKSIDGRLAGIEASVVSAKTTVKVAGVVIAGTFAVCVYLFGTYISKMADALNAIVLM